MRKITSLVVLLLLSVPANAHTQGVLVESFNKCALDKQAQIRYTADSVMVPIAQELVNEGKLTGYGSAYHLWGDEWNVVFWYTAPNLAAFQTGFAELFKRVTQRHPTFVGQVFSWCTEHKDNIYSVAKVTTPLPADAKRP